MLSLATIIGLLAGSLSTYSFVPQVLKCWRLSDTGAISKRMFSVRAFGLVLWTVYGFAVGSVPVLVFSALSLVLSATILMLKIRGSRVQQAGDAC
jgi:MtN3 and saliva related transmembrane protein